MLLIKVPFLFLLKVKLYYSFDPTISHHFPPWFGFISRLGGGLSHFSSANAIAQQRALCSTLHQGRELVLNAGKLRQGIRFFDKINFFFGEIKVRLHQHPQVDKGIFELTRGAINEASGVR